MKTLRVISVLTLFAIGFAAGRFQLPTVRAQNSSPSYGCPSSGSAGAAVSNCAQYLVEISSARLGGGVWVYQLQSSPVDVSALDGNGNAIYQLMQTGFGSMQYFKPSPSQETFTLGPTVP